MPFVRRDHDNEIFMISMNRPRANALNQALVHELRESFRIAREDDEVRAVVLTSECAGFFSVGLDLKEIEHYDRETMLAFWNDFRTLHENIHECPKPVIAALPGHTVAGGIILALACDFRIMARGDFTLAVSGINMGLSLGERVYAMAVQAMGHESARDLFLTGKSISPDRALEIGLIRELVPLELLLDTAKELAQSLVGKSAKAYAEIKAMARESAGYNRAKPADANAFLDRWYSDEAKAIRTAAIESLTASRQA